MRVPDQVKNAVVYLGGRKSANDPASEDWIGTAFVVGLDEPESDGVFFQYLKHAGDVTRDGSARDR
jgi:hypothetical protein